MKEVDAFCINMKKGLARLAQYILLFIARLFWNIFFSEIKVTYMETQNIVPHEVIYLQ